MLKRLAAMAALLLLAGCSSAAPAPTATVVVTQTATVGGTIEPSETPTPTPTVNAEGFLPKRVGEIAGMGGDSGSMQIRFKVTKIVPNFKCTSGYSEKAENGRYLGIWMEVWTTKQVGGDPDRRGLSGVS